MPDPKSPILLLALALAVVIPAAGLGVVCTEYADLTPVRHSFELGAPALVHDAGYLFAVDQHRILQVLDVADPAVMTPVAEIAAPGCEAHELEIMGDHAYVLGDHTLYVVDIATPTAPNIVGSAESTPSLRALALAPGRAYVVTSSAMVTYDISDPTAPTPIGAAVTGYFLSVAVAGDIAYLGQFDGDLQIVDVSDPGHPETLTTLSFEGSVADILAMGDRLYVAAGYAGLSIHAIQTSGVPTLLGAVDTPGYAEQVLVAADVAYVCDEIGGACLIDISDPTTPRVANFALSTYDPIAMALGPDCLYVGDDDWIHAFELASLPLDPVWSFLSTGPVADLAVAGSLACLAGDRTLWTVDVFNPSEPLLVGGCDYAAGANGQGLDVAFDHAYVAARFGGIQVIDVSQPTDPVLVNTIAVNDISQDIAVAGGHAYLLTSDQFDLQVFDLADPAQPAYVTGLSVAGYNYEVVAGSDHLYIVGTEGLKVVDIADPTAPIAVALVDLGATGSTVTLRGDRIYVGTSYDIRIFDASVPSAPVAIGVAATGGSVSGIAAAAEVVYAQSRDRGLQAIEVSDPTSPTILGGIPIAGTGRAAELSGDRVLVAAGYSDMMPHDFGGLYSLPRECADPVSVADPEAAILPSAAVLHRATPNPFNPRTTIAFELRQAGYVSLAIYDLRGRRVARLVEANCSAGRHELIWQGVDDRGRALPSGVFLVRLAAGGETRLGRLTLVR